MKTFKKTFRLICLVLLILLASVGIGLSGGAPIPLLRKREDMPVTIELFESHEDQSDVASEAYKQ